MRSSARQFARQLKVLFLNGLGSIGKNMPIVGLWVSVPNIFQHRVMGGGSSPGPIRSAPSLEEETTHGIFCRLGRLDGGDARLYYAPRRCRRTRGKGAVD